MTEHNETLNVVAPHYEFVGATEDAEQLIESGGRTCYKSEDRITDQSAGPFINHILKLGHESVIEHASATVRYIGSRAMSHQLVRHRLAAYSQESQRYCDYGDGCLSVIAPHCLSIIPGRWTKNGPADWRLTNGDLITETRAGRQSTMWLSHIAIASRHYSMWRKEGFKPEDARFVLPNAVKTEVVVTMNFRAWRHVIKHRALNPRAQWEIRSITTEVLRDFANRWPSVFGDLLCQLKQ